MLQNNPFASNNGLRVIGRTSQSISLCWQIESEIDEEQILPESSEPVQEAGKSESEETTEEDLEIEAERDGNWYQVEMRRDQGSYSWETIYQGYSTHCEINGLPPDSAMIFRLKLKEENEWGSEIAASTETLPASVEDLNRAVEMHSDYLVSRILELTRSSYLKRILHARDRNGMTTLMVASQMGNTTIVEKLILMGSDINAISSGSLRSPLMFACIMGQQNVALLLDRNGAKWKLRDKCGCTAMDYSINCGHLPLVKLAYSRLGHSSLFEKDLSGWTPLMRATVVGDNLDVLKFLVNKGANIHWIYNDKSPLMAAILAKKVNFVRYLLEHGANPLDPNENGTDCLQIARGLQLREISEILLKHISTLDDKEEKINMD